MVERFSDQDYQSIYSRVPRLCVDILIKYKKGVLLKWRNHNPDGNCWHTPGGTVYMNETLEQAAHRIAHEEYGIPIKVQKLLGVSEYMNETDELGFRRQSVSINFLCIASAEDIKKILQPGEIQVFNAVPPDTTPQQAKLVGQALVGLN